MLTKRKIEIFKAIVEEFIATAEPVGSKALLEKYNLDYSSATIRNEMLELESAGLLEKTHTSSGRIPSTQGYRFYVEHLMEDREDDGIEYALAQVFSDRRLNMEEVIRRSCDILSQMTKLTTIVLGPDAMMQCLESVQLLPLNDRSAVAIFVTNQGHTESRIFSFDSDLSLEDIQSCTTVLNERLKGTPLSEVVDKMMLIKPILAITVKRYEMLFEAFINAFLRFATDDVYFSGQSNLLYQPEFADIEKLKQMMAMLENSQLWRSIGRGKGDFLLKKGEHSQLVWMDDMAVVSSKFRLPGDEEGQLMVIGPSRMEYDRILSMIETIASAIEKIYGKGGSHEK